MDTQYFLRLELFRLQIPQVKSIYKTNSKENHAHVMKEKNTPAAALK